ncbi:hypothetical protein C8R47DRAFT_1001122 [Mycena vitilis]|nr:hypothetical protein C8R47DRAFT_1001122 [Mycena vitilis]
MNTNAQTFTDGPAPFDDPSGDIIIRSSENIHFRMHKILLSLASPFFKEMFEIPQPVTVNGGENQRLQSDETRDGIPIIAMYDDQNQACGKEVLEFVLSSCHPARLQSSRPPLPATMVGPIVDVAARYGIDWAIQGALRDPDLLKSNPFILLAHACSKGLEAETRLAARGTLRFSTEDFPNETALKLISGYQYHTLLEFHRRCGKAAAVVARGDRTVKDWVKDPTLRLFPASHDQCSSLQDATNQSNRWNRLLGLPANQMFTSGSLTFSKMSTGHRELMKSSCQVWWIEYMESTAAALESRPHSSTVDEPKRIDAALEKAVACEICAGRAYSFMKSFIPSFEQKIEAIICEIIEQTTFV